MDGVQRLVRVCLIIQTRHLVSLAGVHEADSPTLLSHSITSYHFGCLPGALRKEFIDQQKKEHLDAHNAMYPPPPADPFAMDEDGQPLPPPVSGVPLPPRIKVEDDMHRSFTIPKCWACKKAGGRRCFGCGISGRKAESELMLLFRVALGSLHRC